MPAAALPRAPRRRARPEPIRLRPILADFGIRIVPTARRRQPGETHARAALIEVMTDHGEDHLRLVLRCLREAPANREALRSEIISAVSDVLASEPLWKTQPAQLVASLDAIDLDRMRGRAVALRPWNVRETLRAFLFADLAMALPCAPAAIPDDVEAIAA